MILNGLGPVSSTLTPFIPRPCLGPVGIISRGTASLACLHPSLYHEFCRRCKFFTCMIPPYLACLALSWPVFPPHTLSLLFPSYGIRILTFIRSCWPLPTPFRFSFVTS